MLKEIFVYWFCCFLIIDFALFTDRCSCQPLLSDAISIIEALLIETESQHDFMVSSRSH